MVVSLYLMIPFLYFLNFVNNSKILYCGFLICYFAMIFIMTQKLKNWNGDSHDLNSLNLMVYSLKGIFMKPDFYFS